MKAISIFICFLLIILPPAASWAQETSLEGRVTSLLKDAKAPYTGVLLDPIASSKMLVDNKYIKLEVELQLRKEFAKELAEKRLAFDLLKVEHDSLQKIHTETAKIKDEQMSVLNEILKEEMGNDYTHWWVMGGMALGIILSIAVFYASVEITKQNKE